MPDLQQNQQSDFLKERIKVKPVNKRKLLRRTIITASMAVIFGLIACFTFLILEPVISNWLYPEEKPQNVTFPEDPEEMSPEDMLAENIPEESPTPTPQPTPQPTQTPPQEGIELEEEQIQEILEDVTLDLDNYKELYSAMSEYIDELSRYMVTVTAVTSNIDWFNDVQESRNQYSGVIIAENGMELLILTDYSSIKPAQQLLLTFYDETVVEAQLKQYDTVTDLAVLAVDLASLPEKWTDETDGTDESGEIDETGEELPIASLGSSVLNGMAGTPVVAMGSPMGTGGSVGYGMITSRGTILSVPDRNYRLFLTDIKGSENASGVLFNLQGQVIGIITDDHMVSDMEGVITAYGITELKRIVEKMSNESAVAYMGISGVDVTRQVNQELGVPLGAYVTELDLDSPAMRAGIQPGDVITGIGDNEISNFNSYTNILMGLEPGQTVTVTVMRQAQEEYREMNFSIELGEM